jgi:hypothetical protein
VRVGIPYHSAITKEPMARDPRYAPPATEVADPPLVAALPARPRQVQIAVALLWLSLVLGIPEAILSTRPAPTEDGRVDTVFVVVMLLAFAFTFFLTVKVYQGRNWARIVVLVLTALSITMTLFPFDEPRVDGPLLQGLRLLCVLIDVAAMYLVFSKPGSLWFKRQG